MSHRKNLCSLAINQLEVPILWLAQMRKALLK